MPNTQTNTAVSLAAMVLFGNGDPPVTLMSNRDNSIAYTVFTIDLNNDGVPDVDVTATPRGDNLPRPTPAPTDTPTSPNDRPITHAVPPGRQLHGRGRRRQEGHECNRQYGREKRHLWRSCPHRRGDRVRGHIVATGIQVATRAFQNLRRPTLTATVLSLISLVVSLAAFSWNVILFHLSGPRLSHHIGPGVLLWRLNEDSKSASGNAYFNTDKRSFPTGVVINDSKIVGDASYCMMIEVVNKGRATIELGQASLVFKHRKVVGYTDLGGVGGHAGSLASGSTHAWAFRTDSIMETRDEFVAENGVEPKLYFKLKVGKSERRWRIGRMPDIPSTVGVSVNPGAPHSTTAAGAGEDDKQSEAPPAVIDTPIPE